MGTCNKKYIVISGLNLNDNNRGTAALGYGSISFLKEYGYFKEKQELLKFNIFKNIFKKKNHTVQTTNLNEHSVVSTVVNVFFIEYYLFTLLGIILPFSQFGKFIKNIEFVAAINGGDGFSDIYNTKTFYSRLYDIKIAMRAGIRLILLPQTIGPFELERNKKIAEKILRYSEKVFVRDEKYITELKKIGATFEQTKDLSFYMKPQPWDIRIENGAIGINVSGLAYSNSFRSLAGQFEQYPLLIKRLITHFRDKGHKIYLIPHSYCYKNPEPNNDDMVACKQALEQMEDKSNVYFVDQDLISPQVKYIISQMSFFIGTRMHANFAAIYTGVPVFGLAYSYKFKGAFDANGLDGESQTAMINNITEQDINIIIEKIDSFYKIKYND